MKLVRTQAEWEPIRAAGKRWFLLRYGLLGRGIPLALLCAAAIELSLGNRFPEALRANDFWVRFVLATLVFSVSGSLTANATWNLYERRFGEGAKR